MPAIFDQTMDRRRFLSVAGRAAAGAALVRGLRLSGGADGAPAGEEAVRLALLSDTHIPADSKEKYRNFSPWDNLGQVAPQVAEARPLGVVLNGDAARLTGEVADYEAVRKLLAPLADRFPVYIGLGNHDDRDHFFKVFDHPQGARQNVTGKHVLVMEHPGMRFVMLDSLLYPNKAAGLLGKGQRDWLARYLETSDGRPTILFVHHTLGDGDGDMLDADRFFRVIRPQRKVKAVIYGHSHQYAYSQDEGIHLVNIPAVGYNFSDAEPVGWVDAVFTAAGARLTLRACGGNRAGDGTTRELEWRR